MAWLAGGGKERKKGLGCFARVSLLEGKFCDKGDIISRGFLR